jgi:hypothetical protein
MDFILNLLEKAGWVMFYMISIAVVVPIVYITFDAVTRKDPPPVPRADHVGHVEGLGVNPRDGVVYMATTRGLYFIKEADWADAIGDGYRHISGFKVVGENLFVASGRPDLRDIVSGLAPNVSGYIRSDNSGRTWKTVSLRGEANFRSLDIKHGSVYGFDLESESFMVSEDEGRTWQTRSQPPTLDDIAVDNLDRNVILATTAGTLLLSRDGGRTWQPDEARPLRLVEWPQAGTIWGVDEQGNVFLSHEPGAAWVQQGTLPGPAEAFLADRGSLYAAVFEDPGIAIYTSADAKSWQQIYRDPETASRGQRQLVPAPLQALSP